MLRRLSAEWCAESHSAQEADAPPPWRDESVMRDPGVVARTLRDSIRGMAR